MSGILFFIFASYEPLREMLELVETHFKFNRWVTQNRRYAYCYSFRQMTNQHDLQYIHLSSRLHVEQYLAKVIGSTEN